MSFDNKTTEQVARLARIRLEKKDAAVYAKELTNIFAWIDQLNEVKTDAQSPMLNISGAAMPQRPDEATIKSQQEQLLKNAPERIQDFFAVPKVLNQKATEN